MSRLAKRPIIHHTHIADTLRKTPKLWRIVGTYRARYTAETTAIGIRTAARMTAYQPPGAFEARVEYVAGEPTVLARYVGDGSPATAPAKARGWTRHEAAAAKLRAQPGLAQPIRTYPSLDSAKSIVSQIRRGVLAAYQPAGLYEADWRPSPGRTGWTVYACYIGDPTRREAA